MDNAMKMIGDIVSSLTKILVAVIGLGVVAGIVLVILGSSAMFFQIF